MKKRMETAVNCLPVVVPRLRDEGGWFWPPKKKSKIVIDFISEPCDKPHFN
jgi:hypothetical protein